jgi:site-specific DNA recombinase
VELVPEEERIKVMGTHEKLKTPEEHEAIMERLLKNRMLNPNSRRSIFPLSGLLYCEKCGSRMRFRVGENKKQGQHWSALCYHQYKDGSKCEQRGKTRIFYGRLNCMEVGTMIHRSLSRSKSRS